MGVKILIIANEFKASSKMIKNGVLQYIQDVIVSQNLYEIIQNIQRNK